MSSSTLFIIYLFYEQPSNVFPHFGEVLAGEALANQIIGEVIAGEVLPGEAIAGEALAGEVLAWIRKLTQIQNHKLNFIRLS